MTTVAWQIFYSAIICYLSISMGISFAFPSGTSLLFKSNETTLHRPMTQGEASLFGSLSSIGAVIGTMIAGSLMDVLGRKGCAVLASLCYVVSWSMIVIFSRVEVVLVAVFIAGLGSAAMLIVRLYVSEICQESIRGAMTTGSLIFCSLGILMAYAMSGWTSYYTMLYTYIGIAAAGFVLIAVLKESPTYLMKKGLEEDAAKSIAFFRHLKLESKEVAREIEKLRRTFIPDFAMETVPEEEKLNPEVPQLQVDIKSIEKVSLWTFMKKSRATRQALFVVLSLVALGTFQGLTVLQVYAQELFAKAVPNTSSTVCSIIGALVTLGASVVSGYLSDFSGRRPLLIYSSLAAGLCCVILGTQLQMHWAPDWATVLFIYVFCVLYTFGGGTVPYVLVTDCFMPEIKSFVSTIIIEWSWMSCFILLYVFGPLVEWLGGPEVGLGPTFYIFSCMCLATAIFTFFLLPETKGLPVDVVQDLFKRSVVSGLVSRKTNR